MFDPQAIIEAVKVVEREELELYRALLWPCILLLNITPQVSLLLWAC